MIWREESRWAILQNYFQRILSLFFQEVIIDRRRVFGCCCMQWHESLANVALNIRVYCTRSEHTNTTKYSVKISFFPSNLKVVYIEQKPQFHLIRQVARSRGLCSYRMFDYQCKNGLSREICGATQQFLCWSISHQL